MSYKNQERKGTSRRTTWSPKKKSSKAWNKIESRVVKRVGGKTTKASGAHWTQKGDGRTYGWVIEVKSTSKDTFYVSDSITKRLLKDAFRSGRDPVLLVNFEEYGVILYVFPEYGDEMEDYKDWPSKTIDIDTAMVKIVSGGKTWKVLPEAEAKKRLHLDKLPDCGRQFARSPYSR